MLIDESSSNSAGAHSIGGERIAHHNRFGGRLRVNPDTAIF
jgi:hypothetical protein